jgi:hypothetical protein
MRRWKYAFVLGWISIACSHAVRAPSAPERAPAQSSHTQTAPLASWRLAPDAATLSRLVFGMSFESAWDAEPRLRDAMRVELDADEFDALARRRPELAPDSGGGGYSHGTWRYRQGTWPAVDGPRWELRFSSTRGLSSVTARFVSEEALRSAVASWGPPDIDARWQVWTDEETHTQAAFTGCEHASYLDGQPIGEPYCTLEWMPMQSAREVVRTVFPERGTLIGIRRSALRFGTGVPFRELTRFYLWPVPADLWLSLEVQFDADERVSAYRTALPHTYDPSARPRNLEALREVLPALDPSEECSDLEIDGHRVSVCDRGSQLVITVGVWR